MKTHFKDNRRKGLTLIELMFGAVLTAMLALAVYGVFCQGLAVQGRLMQSGSGLDDGFWILHCTARDLERALRKSAADVTERAAVRDLAAGEGIRLLYLNYDEDGGGFWYEEPQDGTRPSVVRIELALSEQGSPEKIMRDIYAPFGF